MEKKDDQSFESDIFDPLKDKPHKWCLVQKKRLDCIYPNSSPVDINERILGQCKGSLEHAIRCRIDIDSELTDLIGVMEEVVEMTGLNKKYGASTLTKKENVPQTSPKESTKMEEPPRSNSSHRY